MKRTIISLTLALGLVMALALPAAAFPPPSQVGATVTVPFYVSFTVTDNPDPGLSFGAPNPGTTDNPEQAQPGDSAVTLTVGAETNANLNLQTRGGNFVISLASGAADSGTATTLVDADGGFVAAGVATGDTVTNLTDGSTGTISAVTADTLTFSAGLTGGVDNLVQAGDSYSISAASPSATIEISNAKWNTSDDTGTATAMSTSYATVGSSSKGVETSVELYHWLSIPNGKDPGTYAGLFSYRVV